MDNLQFDRFTRRLVLGGLAAAVGLGSTGYLDDVSAKRRKKKKKKVWFNEFGCVNVGNFCQDSEQCCSGICQGEEEQAQMPGS